MLPTWLRASDSLPRDVTFTAAIDIAAAAADGANGAPSGGGGRPKFTINAYDGSLLSLEYFFYPVIVDLEGVKARRKVKALREHSRDRIVGHATDTRITIGANGGISVQGVMSGNQVEVQDIIDSHKAGFPWEGSIGAQITRREFLEAGESENVNGRRVEGPCIIARECLLYEISFTSIGAADETSVAIAASGVACDAAAAAPPIQSSTNSSEGSSMTFEQWLKAKGFDPASITAQQGTSLRAVFNAEVPPVTPTGTTPGNSNPAPAAAPAAGTSATTPPVQASAAGGNPTPAVQAAAAVGGADVTASVLATFRQESLRVDHIARICAQYSDPKIEVGGAQVPLQAHAIAQGWDAEKTELHALRAARPAAPNMPFGGGAGGPDHAQVIECSMCLAGGMSPEFLEKKAGFSQPTINAAMDSRVRGFGIQQLIFASLHAQGIQAQFGRMDNETIKAALMSDPRLNGTLIRAAQGFSTISLSGILGNLANKAMLQRFALFTSVVPEIAYETDTNDFKPFTRYRLDGSGVFGQVGPDGQLKHIGLIQSEYANQLQTRGGMIALTRQMIINDDLGAFLQIPQLFAELAIHAREQMTFETLLGNAGTFFGVGNLNLITDALSIAGLTAAVKAFRELKNAGGKFVMLNPGKVLVAPFNEALAKQLYTSTHLVGSTTANVLMPEDNPHAGAYRPVVSPYLSEASGIAGADNDDWYLFADPASGMAALEIGYLRGQRTPVIDSAEAAFDTLGMQWRAYWDFGVALMEKRAGIKADVA
ncbi:MAG TPA: hypothetical protein VES36_05700 [Candidatus Limnocylindrales bacterium]|nr:hypothetical protein [Candidatus Limnocylindrales bacterium]